MMGPDLSCPQYSPTAEVQEERLRRDLLCTRICSAVSTTHHKYSGIKRSLHKISTDPLYETILRSVYLQLQEFRFVLPNLEGIRAVGWSQDMDIHTILFDTEHTKVNSDLWWHRAQMEAYKTSEFFDKYPTSVRVVHGLVKETIEFKPDKEYIEYALNVPEYTGIRGGEHCQTCTKSCKLLILS
jgi:hypothetical protein